MLSFSFVFFLAANNLSNIECSKLLYLSAPNYGVTHFEQNKYDEVKVRDSRKTYGSETMIFEGPKKNMHSNELTNKYPKHSSKSKNDTIQTNDPIENSPQDLNEDAKSQTDSKYNVLNILGLFIIISIIIISILRLIKNKNEEISSFCKIFFNCGNKTKDSFKNSEIKLISKQSLTPINYQNFPSLENISLFKQYFEPIPISKHIYPDLSGLQGINEKKDEYISFDKESNPNFKPLFTRPNENIYIQSDDSTLLNTLNNYLNSNTNSDQLVKIEISPQENFFTKIACSGCQMDFQVPGKNFADLFTCSECKNMSKSSLI